MNSKISTQHKYWNYFAMPLILGMLLILNVPRGIASPAQISSVKEIENTEDRPSFANNCQKLLEAVKFNDIGKVKELLQSVNPNCEFRKDGEPRSPLVTAARNGNLEIVQLLLDSGPDVEFHTKGDEPPLIAAAQNGHLSTVKLLIEIGADANRQSVGNGTALTGASKYGHINVVIYLISEKVDINAQVNGDGTPLICAVRNGHHDVSKLLVENGADPYFMSSGDEYAMYHARVSGNKAMIELLEKSDREN